MAPYRIGVPAVLMLVMIITGTINHAAAKSASGAVAGAIGQSAAKKTGTQAVGGSGWYCKTENGSTFCSRVHPK